MVQSKYFLMISKIQILIVKLILQIGVVEIMPNVKNNRCQNILWTVGSIHVNAQDIPMDSTRPSRESAK